MCLCPGEQCSLNWLGGFPALLLKSANFTDADLHSANLRGSSLEDASFEDADIHMSICREAIWREPA
jgi:uncharacterized protein YjbI with pentapeptide repeats